MKAKKPRDLTISRLFGCREGFATFPALRLVNRLNGNLFFTLLHTVLSSMPGCSKQTVCDGRVGYG